MAVLDQQVHGRDHPPVGRPEHRGVVTDSDQLGGAGRGQRLDLGDEPELPQVGDGDGGPPPRSSGGRPDNIGPVPADGGSYGSVAPTLGAQEDGMVQAYILVQTEVGKAAEVAVQIGQITGVTQADDVTGPYDVIVRAEADNVDDLGKLVVAQIQGVQGITRTLTCPIVHI
jgi:DNA-binding Lrp family transcriptional regulator